MILGLLIVVLLGLIAFHVASRYNRAAKLINKLPGPRPLPILGNLLKFNKSCRSELWNEARELNKKYYPITRIWLVKSAFVCVMHPDDLQVILSSQKNIDKGYIYDRLSAWLKTGLLTSAGDKWRQRRKILTPAFHFNILKKYLDIINDESERCVINLKEENNDLVKSLLPFTSEITLNIICESAMGVAVSKMESNVRKNYKKAVHDFGAVNVYRLTRPYIFDWMMKLPWKWSTIHKNALRILHKFTNDVVKERRAYHEKTNHEYLKSFDQNDEGTACGSKKRLAMLDLLFAAEQSNLIDDEGIKEEVDTFTFEGHDTTGMALTFTLMLLAENKDSQDRARDEVAGILDRTEGKLDMASIQEFDYLDRVIKESLRLYPPVATVFRCLSEDLQLKHGLIPRGSDLLISFYDTHRDPNFWPEPDKFDPDRFLPERSKNRHPFAYVPFSAGPRNCIGQKFAMMELKSLIARILYEFYLDPIDRQSDMKLTADIVIRPLKPIRIKFVKINKNNSPI